MYLHLSNADRILVGGKRRGARGGALTESLARGDDFLFGYTARGRDGVGVGVGG